MPRRRSQAQAEQDQQTIQELLQEIIQRNPSLLEMIQQAHAQASATLAIEQEKQQTIAQAAAVDAAGGIYGFKGNNPLDSEELAFRSILIDMGIIKDTANEVFRQGIDGTSSLGRMAGETIKNTIRNINENKSPDCPDPSKIFLHAMFGHELNVLKAWIQFQRVIGAPDTAIAFKADPNDPRAGASDRLEYFCTMKSPKWIQDVTKPDPLTNMKTFHIFRDCLRKHLWTRRGVANVPLVYVIRDDESVTDLERNGTVGTGANDSYRDWDQYAIRCTVMNGAHWDSDNASVWRILSELVRDDPAWDCIRSYRSVRDGRGAYMALSQTFQRTYVRRIKEEARTALRNLKYGGDTRSWNYEKYVRGWRENIYLLRKFDDCPKEEDLVWDFVCGITDPRLDSAIERVFVEGSPYIDNFEKTQQYFRTILDWRAHRKGYDGPLEARNYSGQEWGSMNLSQKNTVRNLRQAKASEEANRKRKTGNQFGSNARKKKKKKTSNGKVRTT